MPHPELRCRRYVVGVPGAGRAGRYGRAQVEHRFTISGLHESLAWHAARPTALPLFIRIVHSLDCDGNFKPRKTAALRTATIRTSCANRSSLWDCCVRNTMFRLATARAHASIVARAAYGQPLHPMAEIG